jgi:1-acyl-sn-glycerol-3-phosphate acyltransferase
MNDFDAEARRLNKWQRGRRFFKDSGITILLWTYFTLGFIIIFSPFYLIAFLFFKNKSTVFQHLNSRFYQGFFFLCRILIPRQKWEIDPAIQTIRGSIVMSNHLSYLDSILLVSLFPDHSTIAKASLFNIPIFGRMLGLSGYIPSSGEGPYAELLLNSLESIRSLLERGGNFIVFPEGTRSRDGRFGPMNRGAFKIAKSVNAPIKLLKIENTHRLFTPGKFSFNTSISNIIRVRLIGDLHPDYHLSDFSIKKLMQDVRMLEEK